MIAWMKWIGFNGLFLLLLGAWKLLEVEGAGNIVVFGVWLMFIVATLAAFAPTKAFKNVPVSPVPGWVDAAFDWVVVGVLVWFGHLVLGTVYALHMAGVAVVRSKTLQSKEMHDDEES